VSGEAQTLLEERRGDVAVLILNHPAKRNALDPDLCLALAARLGSLAAEGARAVVLTATGDKAFSAGFDLGALKDEAAFTAANRFEALIAAAGASPLPIVCALNGVAFGGGLELAATCDLRVGHAGVKLSMPPARLGIVYPPRGLGRFVALVGESRARELFLTARVLEAQTAAAWGLIDHLVLPEEVLPRALALAGEMAALAPLAVQGMRRTFEALVAARAALPAEAAAELGRLREAAWVSEDALEGKRAFAEKRPPVFRGR
jgi:enoyl-CoA hydratase/carnithine racemase